MWKIVSDLVCSAPAMLLTIALAVLTGSFVLLQKIINRPEPWHILGQLADRVVSVGPARFKPSQGDGKRPKGR